MRKAMIVFLTAVILLTVCFGSLYGCFLGVADDVTVVRNTLYGDDAAADGLNILVRNQYYQNLLWETSLKLDRHPAPHTEFTFDNEYLRIPEDPEYSGLEFNAIHNVFLFLHADAPASVEEKYGPLLNALNEAIDAVPEGQSKTFGLNFANYLDYYPLEGQVILPELTTVFSELDPWYADSEEIATAINNFFRIPLDGVFTVDYTVDKSNPGSSYGASVDMNYQPDASGVATEDACYFTFNTLMDDGSVVDTSLIPGGYGIYRLPYDESGLHCDALEMVYALDPTEGYSWMKLSADGKRIRLYTRQGQDLMLTIIDIATMTQLQKTKILTYSDEWNYHVMDYDDFTLISENRVNSDSMDQISVWEETSDGTWSRAFTVKMNLEVFPEGSNLNLFGKYSNAVDYRDGKLAVIINRTIYQEPYWYREYCDLYVAVYDANGMAYAGTCEWNLTQVNAMDPSGTKIRPTNVMPMEVSW